MIRIFFISLFFTYALQAREPDVCVGEVLLEKIDQKAERNKSPLEDQEITYTATFRVKKDLSKNFRGKKKIIIKWTEFRKLEDLIGRGSNKRSRYGEYMMYKGKLMKWTFYKDGNKFSVKGKPVKI